MLNGEYGLECEVHEDGICLEHFSEFKYLGCVLTESDTDGAESRRKMSSGRKVACVIRSLITASNLQFECARVFH